MAEFREDVDIYPVMLELVDCLCAELEASGLPAPCRCGLMPGDAPVIDFTAGPDGCKDGCGQAWVRLVTAFSSADFPNPALNAVSNCSTGLAYQLEVGVSRCEPAGTTIGNRFVPPTREEQTDAVRLYTADMQAMRRAVLCCLPGRLDGPRDLEIVLGTYTPLTSQGGSGGGFWTLFLRRI